MRDKKESIHQFILELEREKNRERAVREKLLRENFLGSTEQLPTSQLESFNIPAEVSTKETRLLSGRNQPTDKKQESDLSVTEHVEIGNLVIQPFKAGVFAFKQKGCHLKTELEISSVLAAFSFISTIVLLRMDALINQNLYSYGHQVLKGIIPYWIAFNTTLGMFWAIVTAAILFRMYASTHKQMTTDE